MSAGTESDAVSPTTVIANAETLAPGDEVQIAREGYEWANPLEVQSVDVTEWLSDAGVVKFTTAKIELSSAYNGGSTHLIKAVSNTSAYWQQGETTDALVAFDPVDNDGEAASEQDGGDQRAPGLPDGTSVADVEAAVGRSEYLREVADDLGVSESRARATIFQLDLYRDIKEGGRYT